MNTTAIDLFAGCGGFTEGASAVDVPVIWAANHWLDAVNCHAANHPETQHVCQDLQQADWTAVPDHDLLLASPSCQGHARARGKERPHHDAARSTAWAVVECAEVHRQHAAVIENVPEFLDWVLFPAWRTAMEALGYAMSYNVLDAADFGVPQNRVRLIIVATRSKAPLVIKAPKILGQYPIAPFIDWSDAPKWRKIDRTLAKNTRDRIKNGRRDFGSRFIMPYYGSGSGLTGRSVDRPVGTITTLDRWAIVDGDRMRMFSVDECRAAMGFRPDYVLPKQKKLAKHMLGNAICPPLASFVIGEVLRAA
jgi:DNA (cytosine-5)-methyltransferase 1